MEQSRHGEGITSVKYSGNRPGGNTTIDLFGGYGGEDNTADRQRQPKGGQSMASANAAAEEDKKDEEEKKDDDGVRRPAEGVQETYDAFGNKVAGTSVRVRAPPGGASSITF